MLTIPRDRTTLNELQELLRVLYRRRDELYAVAVLLQVDDHTRICCRLADQLGGHAADLEQIIIANGVRPVAPSSTKHSSDLHERMASEGRSALATAEQFEHDMSQHYDRTIECVADREVEGLLCKQRDEIEFGVCVLRNLNTSSAVCDELAARR